MCLKLIGAVTGDQVIPMNELMKKESASMLTSDRSYVFVCPIYAWMIPKAVETFIRQTSFGGNKEAYFVLTCGDETGNTIHYMKRLCKDKDFDLKGLSGVVMPINHIVLHDRT